MLKKQVISDWKGIITTRHVQKGLLRTKVAKNADWDDSIQKTNDCKRGKFIIFKLKFFSGWILLPLWVFEAWKSYLCG